MSDALQNLTSDLYRHRCSQKFLNDCQGLLDTLQQSVKDLTPWGEEIPRGIDPFEIRKPRLITSQLKNVTLNAIDFRSIPTAKLDAFFETLNVAKECPVLREIELNMTDLADKKDCEINGIPKILHSVWIGDLLTGKRYMDNIQSFRLHNGSFTHILWSSLSRKEIQYSLLHPNEEKSKQIRGMRAFCANNGIKLLNFHEVFAGKNTLEEFMTLEINRNQYGATSDLARPLILKAFGGQYQDTDVCARGPIDENFMAAREFAILLVWGLPTNVIMLSRRNHPFWDRYIAVIAYQYQKPVCQLFGNALVEVIPGLKCHYTTEEVRGFLRPEVIWRSGPAALKIALDQSDLINEDEPVLKKRYMPVEVSLKNIEVSFYNSWLHDGGQLPACNEEDALYAAQRTISNILFDLWNEPQVLNLDKYERYFAAKSAPSFRTQVLQFVTTYYKTALEEVTTFHIANTTLTSQELELLVTNCPKLVPDIREALDAGNQVIAEYILKKFPEKRLVSKPFTGFGRHDLPVAQESPERQSNPLLFRGHGKSNILGQSSPVFEG